MKGKQVPQADFDASMDVLEGAGSNGFIVHVVKFAKELSSHGSEENVSNFDEKRANNLSNELKYREVFLHQFYYYS